MGDWLLSIARWLEVNVIGLPIYLAAPAMIIIGALDSSLLSLPEINDYLVVGRCFKHPTAVYYFPLFAAVGSVLGCHLLYTIVRRGRSGCVAEEIPNSKHSAGGASLRPIRFSRDRRSGRAAAAVAVQDFCRDRGRARVSALEVFVDGDDCTLGSLLCRRNSRCLLRPESAAFLRDNGLVIVSIVATLVLIGAAVYIGVKRRRGSAVVYPDSERTPD
jgi:hypothetical protein